MGIGSPAQSNSKTWSDFYGDKIFKAVQHDGIVGDVVSRFYNIKGVYIINETNQRIIGISPQNLLKTKYRIGVAESSEKASALIGAMKGQFINVLVTAEETAQNILSKVKYR